MGRARRSFDSGIWGVRDCDLLVLAEDIRGIETSNFLLWADTGSLLLQVVVRARKAKEPEPGWTLSR